MVATRLSIFFSNEIGGMGAAITSQEAHMKGTLCLEIRGMRENKRK